MLHHSQKNDSHAASAFIKSEAINASQSTAFPAGGVLGGNSAAFGASTSALMINTALPFAASTKSPAIYGTKRKLPWLAPLSQGVVVTSPQHSKQIVENSQLSGTTTETKRKFRTKGLPQSVADLPMNSTTSYILDNAVSLYAAARKKNLP